MLILVAGLSLAFIGYAVHRLRARRLKHATNRILEAVLRDDPPIIPPNGYYYSPSGQTLRIYDGTDWKPAVSK